jgi:hypothetical protein
MLGLCSLIYTLNIPFFEKCKSNEEAWPWQTDPEGHQRSFKRMTIKTAINTLLIGNFFDRSLTTNFAPKKRFFSTKKLDSKFRKKILIFH